MSVCILLFVLLLSCTEHYYRHPFGYGENVSGSLPLMIASGDVLGRVLIWNVRTGDPMAVLADAGTVFGGKDKARVVAVSWVTMAHILAILLDHGRLILWDCKSMYFSLLVCVYCEITMVDVVSCRLVQMEMWCGKRS